VNPDRAQAGSGLTGGCPAQPSALAGEICARGDCAADGSRRGCCWELPLHATARSETAAAAIAARYRDLIFPGCAILLRYAAYGYGAAPSTAASLIRRGTGLQRKKLPGSTRHGVPRRPGSFDGRG
jgi:hypothetical protein